MAEKKKQTEGQSSIPTSKVRRATRFVRSGLKVGRNYVNHYSKKLVNGDANKDDLHQKNAEEIYDTLSELKGSALKVAQMLSMDRSMLPTAFIEQFSQAQYQAPPLSGPLIVKTFRDYFGQSPSELYDQFEMKAAHAASIGQVHRAQKDGETLAVKIQYPGVRDSVISDINMVFPIARRMFGWKEKDLKVYMEEVTERLVEETDYTLELERSQEISAACSDLPNLHFSTYFPELSCDRVISMKWMDGIHLDRFLASNPDQDTRDRAGQALWDFYNYQVHELKKMQADAHPGNFLFQPDGSVTILDFGCVKTIPEDFYKQYFTLLQRDVLDDEERFHAALRETGMLLPEDTDKDIELYSEIGRTALELVCRPFHQEQFDFGDNQYFDEIYAFGEKAGKMPELRKSKAPRGSKDGIYLNRAYFGLYSILNKLGARVATKHYFPETIA